MPKGDVYLAINSLKPKRQLMPNEAARVATDMAAAVACLHALEIVHRDIKLTNMLVAGSTQTER